MLVILKPGATDAQVGYLTGWLLEQDFKIHRLDGDSRVILGLSGDATRMEPDQLLRLDFVESVRRITEPYPLSARRNHPQDTVIEVGGVKIGGGSFAIIAGPCSVESEEQILGIAESVKAAGANILRGGAFKPRSSPYSFQGLGEDGIRLLLNAKHQTGLPVITEVMDVGELPFYDEVDILQVGARNMQNFAMLKELGRLHKPVMLKRGMASTLQELLMSAEYLMSEGNTQVILCERGIRTFETAARNTLDISAIPLLHEMSHLPVIVDPSHGCGRSALVPPMACAAAAAGADGMMIEVHNDPAHALCDGVQALTPEQFRETAARCLRIRGALRD